MKYKIDFRAYSDALENNQLLGLKCNACGCITCPPKMVCRECTSRDQEVVRLSGKGEIRTFTTSYVAPQGREEEAPYTITMVELEEGPWISGNLSGIAPEDVTMDIIGKKVSMSHKVFQGDVYSSDKAACPAFHIDE